jgi:hypothetical protein
LGKEGKEILNKSWRKDGNISVEDIKTSLEHIKSARRRDIHFF